MIGFESPGFDKAIANLCHFDQKYLRPFELEFWLFNDALKLYLDTQFLMTTGSDVCKDCLAKVTKVLSP